MKVFITLFMTASMAVVVLQSTANEDGAVLIKIDEALKGYWRVEKKVAPKYPGSAIRSRQQGCATVGYFIDSDGSTSGHWVIVSHPKKTFDRSAIEANKKFTYTPGDLNPDSESVMTLNTFTYQLSSPGQTPTKESREAKTRLCEDAAIKLIEIEYGPLS